jgi:hypothetical protein
MVERLVGTARELSRGFAGLGQRLQCVHWWRALSYVLGRRGTFCNRGTCSLGGDDRVCWVSCCATTMSRPATSRHLNCLINASTAINTKQIHRTWTRWALAESSRAPWLSSSCPITSHAVPRCPRTAAKAVNRLNSQHPTACPAR